MARKGIFVLAFVHTEWRGTEKLYERRENMAAFTKENEAYDAAENEAKRMKIAYDSRGWYTDDSDVVVGLMRYKNEFIDGTWNFYVDELPLD